MPGISCGSGEETYSLALIWHFELQSRFSGMEIEIVATEVDPHLLQHARTGAYTAGSLRELPDEWRDRAFARDADKFHLEPEYRQKVQFSEQDIREGQPEVTFDLVLCRNLAFTYFDEIRQGEILKRIISTIHDGAVLVLGAHERLPNTEFALTAWSGCPAIYRMTAPLREGNLHWSFRR